MVANTILASHDTGDEEVEQANILPIESKDNFSRMAVIRQAQNTTGVSEETMRFLEDAQRASTRKTYDNGWKIWVAWCQKKNLDFTEYNINNILAFLTDNKHSKRNQPVPVPADHKLQTWDVDVVIQYIKANLGNNQATSLKSLQQKTIILLCIATMPRPRSDIGNIQYRDTRLEYDSQDTLAGARIYFRLPKETQLKTCTIGIVQDQSICPVFTLHIFLERTLPLRINLPVKDIMKQAGIDTEKYSPHPIRSAASTKAVEKGHSIENVKQHANWSRNTQTFERFYYKPTTTLTLGSQITNSIFSTENLTTLEAGAEATEIVLGTTNNQNVAEVKAENVVNAHPTSWFSNLRNLF
ncbi:hypothetical protein G6F36_008294 [Rhizopus arrhizus]|nr:hypothetical protein G6F36_008294 [Rhizopus arrhizus]